MNQIDLRCTEGKWKVVLWIHYVDGQSCFISETMLVHILHILQEHDSLFIYYRCLSYHPGIKELMGYYSHPAGAGEQQVTQVCEWDNLTNEAT